MSVERPAFRVPPSQFGSAEARAQQVQGILGRLARRFFPEPKSRHVHIDNKDVVTSCNGVPFVCVGTNDHKRLVLREDFRTYQGNESAKRVTALFFAAMQVVGLATIWSCGSPMSAFTRVVFVFCVVATNVLYARLWSNAGSCGFVSVDGSEVDVDLLTRLQPDESMWKRCRFCNFVRPLRAKHCHRCGRCVSRFDHHCSWLGVCVGGDNVRSFICLLACMTTALCIATGKVIGVYAMSCDPQRQTCCDIYGPAIPLLLALVLVGCGATCFAGFTLLVQVVMVSGNYTTYEILRKQPVLRLASSRRSRFESLWDRGFFTNWADVLCGRTIGQVNYGYELAVPSSHSV